MSTLRKQTRSGYTHVSNEIIDAEGISYRAKGIALVLLSKPDNWIIKISYLMAHGKEGEQAIRTAMHELAEHGFLMRDRVLDASGAITTVTYIADYPAYINVGTVDRRINGYEPKPTDLAVSEMSETRRSETRDVGNGEVLVTPDLTTTDAVKVNRKNKKKAPAAQAPKRNYHPDEYSDIIL